MNLDDVSGKLSEFGKRAQHSVIPLTEGKALACLFQRAGPRSGGTGQGCIGAMAAVGLRRTGNDVTCIGLRVIRDIAGMVTAGTLLASFMNIAFGALGFLMVLPVVRRLEANGLVS